jgi:hypothetical protein
MAGRVDEAKRILAVEGAVVEAGGNRLPLDDLQRRLGFGMACKERFHHCGVGLRRQELLVIRLGGAEGKHGQVDRGGPPQLAVGQGKLEPQAVAPFGVAAVTVKRRLNRALRLLTQQLADLRPQAEWMRDSEERDEG